MKDHNVENICKGNGKPRANDKARENAFKNKRATSSEPQRTASNPAEDDDRASGASERPPAGILWATAQPALKDEERAQV